MTKNYDSFLLWVRSNEPTGTSYAADAERLISDSCRVDELEHPPCIRCTDDGKTKSLCDSCSAERWHSLVQRIGSAFGLMGGDDVTTLPERIKDCVEGLEERSKDVEFRWEQRFKTVVADRDEEYRKVRELEATNANLRAGYAAAVSIVNQFGNVSGSDEGV